MIPYSVLDLSPIAEGSDARQALLNSASLAAHAEALGYTRFWLAEHHNMTGIASAATAVAIGFVAGRTSHIRVGAGGIMLPNHSPLVVAEQFGTLATLHPGRIDLGLGRAPGTDMETARALRRNLEGGDRFPQDVIELIGYLADEAPGEPAPRVRAVPGTGTQVPVFILGSSLYGAQLAAYLGLPYAFASHFAPAALDDAVAVYREGFRPSERWPAPHFILALNVFAAASDREAQRLETSMVQAFANLRTGRPGPLPRPVDDVEAVVDPAALAMARGALKCSVVGAPETVRAGLGRFIEAYRPDEVILTGQIHDHEARLASFAIAAEAMAGLARGEAAARDAAE